MAFWSGEKLALRIPQDSLIDPFSPDRIDCSAYTLCVGREVYVSPSEAEADPQQTTMRILGADESFTIPPGQFAFLLTEESVFVPHDAMALISIKSRIKWRGLVNVSGFHVDPGFRGNLIFSVFNAGPASIHLRHGDPCFLIWYTDLDRDSQSVKNGATKVLQKSIGTDLINRISGELKSLNGLSKKITDVQRELNDKIHRIERDHAVLRWMFTLLLTIAVAVGAWIVRGYLPSPETHAGGSPAAATMPAPEAAPSAAPNSVNAPKIPSNLRDRPGAR